MWWARCTRFNPRQVEGPFNWPLGRAFRCKTCAERFYACPESTLAAADHTKRPAGGRHRSNRLRRRMVEAASFVMLLVLFWSFLIFLTCERAT
jgi:hypothetical protein